MMGITHTAATPAALSVWLCVCPWLAGCDSEPDVSGAVARDSAGVRIVESLRPAWLEGEPWAVGSEPLLRIGVMEGEEPPVLNAVGPLPDGSFVLEQLWGVRRTAEETRTGFRRDSVAFVRFGPAGALLDTVAMLPGREIYLREQEGRGMMITPLVGRNAVGVTRPHPEPGTAVVGDQTTFELRELAPDGTLLRIFRIPGRDLTVDPTEVQRMVEEWVESVPPRARPGLRATMENQPLPDSMPAYGELRTDRGSNLWVAEWTRAPTLPRRWTVLDPEGAWLGEIEVPTGFRPHDIGDDWILGVETDEMDIEYVVVYPLRKGSMPGP